MIDKTNYIEFDGCIYAFDLDALMRWVSETPANEKNISTEVTHVYPLNVSGGECGIFNKGEAVEKSIIESKPSKNDVMNNIRYDIVKDMMSMIISPSLQGDGTLRMINSLDMLTMGQKICWNTLVEANILIEITEND